MRDIGRLPVVSKDDDTELVGVITRSDIIKSYNKKVMSTIYEKRETE